MNDIENGAYYIVAITVDGSVKHEHVYASSTSQARDIARSRVPRFPARQIGDGQVYQLVRD
jgi:hypothetical protein